MLPSHLSLFTDLKAALQSQKADEIDRLLDELNNKALDAKTKEALEEISDEVLMTEFGGALKIVDQIVYDLQKAGR